MEWMYLLKTITYLPQNKCIKQSFMCDRHSKFLIILPTAVTDALNTVMTWLKMEILYQLKHMTEKDVVDFS